MSCSLLLQGPLPPTISLQPVTANVTLQTGSYRVTQQTCPSSVTLQQPQAPSVALQTPQNAVLALSVPSPSITLAAPFPPAAVAAPAQPANLVVCPPGIQIGTCVYFTQAEQEGLPVVGLCDPTQDAKMPCAAIINALVSPTQATVRFSGLIEGLSGLMPGATYYAGPHGQPVLTSVLEALQQDYYLQPVGVALGTASFRVNPQQIVAKRVV